MAISQIRSKRTPSGGRYIAYRKKRLNELGRDPTYTKLDKTRVRTLRVKGGHRKNVLLSADVVNVYNPQTKTYAKSKILTVVGNTANRHFIRRNIITRGAVIRTELGNAKITSRPGQEKVLNAVLLPS